MKPPWNGLLRAAWSSQAHQHLDETCSSPGLNFSLTQKFLIFFLALLIAKYDQPRTGDQKMKDNIGRSYCHVTIQLPQSHSDQTSTVAPPRISNSCSREENEQVMLIGSNNHTGRGGREAWKNPISI